MIAAAGLDDNFFVNFMTYHKGRVDDTIGHESLSLGCFTHYVCVCVCFTSRQDFRGRLMLVS